jgi:hypothetical protein
MWSMRASSSSVVADAGASIDQHVVVDEEAGGAAAAGDRASSRGYGCSCVAAMVQRPAGRARCRLRI